MIGATALRLATIAALTNGGHNPLPTLAGDLIFDSRLDPFSDLTKEDRLATVIVSTGEISGDASGPSRGWPFDVSVDLEIELAVSSFIEQDGSITAQTVESDPIMDASLDRLQAQVRNCLHGHGQWAQLWQSQARATASFNSIRFATEAGRAKTANRLLKITTKICEDPPGSATITHEGTDYVVPQPLATVAQAILTNGEPESAVYQYALELIAASSAIPSITLPTVSSWRVRYQVDAIDLVDPNLAPDGVGPDGHVELEFESSHVSEE
jgi:hypothetical protein